MSKTAKTIIALGRTGGAESSSLGSEDSSSRTLQIENFFRSKKNRLPIFAACLRGSPSSPQNWQSLVTLFPIDQCPVQIAVILRTFTCLCLKNSCDDLAQVASLPYRKPFDSPGRQLAHAFMAERRVTLSVRPTLFSASLHS